MEAQKTYAQVPQSMVLAVLLSTLLLGGIGGYAVRASGAGQPAGSERTQLIPRTEREGVEITPIQAPAPRWTHEDDTTSK